MTIVCIALSWLINISFSTGIHPDKLKIAKVISIYKKGSQLMSSNYRPISLLSNINKIFEKLVFSRVYKFLDKYDCLYDLQFGFREKHSIDHALINISEKSEKLWIPNQALTTKNMPVVFLLIFKKLLILSIMIYFLINSVIME